MKRPRGRDITRQGYRAWLERHAERRLHDRGPARCPAYWGHWWERGAGTSARTRFRVEAHRRRGHGQGVPSIWELFDLPF